MPSGAPRDLLAGTRLAANPGFAGRQTDTGEEIEIEFTPDNKAHRLRRDHQSRPGRARVHRFAAVRRRRDRRRTARHHHRPEQLVMAAIHARRPHPARPGRAAGRQRRTTPRVSRPSRGRCRANHASSPNGIDRVGEQLRDGAGFAHRVLHGRGCRQREAVLGAARAAARCRPCSASTKGSYTNVVIPERANNLVLYGTWESASSPAEVALMNPQNGKALVLTRFNAARVARLDLPPDREFLVHVQPRQAHPQFRGAAARIRRRRRNTRCSS